MKHEKMLATLGGIAIAGVFLWLSHRAETAPLFVQMAIAFFSGAGSGVFIYATLLEIENDKVYPRIGTVIGLGGALLILSHMVLRHIPGLENGTKTLVTLLLLSVTICALGLGYLERAKIRAGGFKYYMDERSEMPNTRRQRDA